ncbi:MAG: SAM-dependent methyltransferase [Bacteroidales bacterium]
MMNKGHLFLIPSPLGECDFATIFPTYNSEIIETIDAYIVEDLRTSRRFLKKLGLKKTIDDLEFFLLNEHTQGPDMNQYLQNCLDGKNMGLLSDAGTPCVADPGNIVVAKAHQLEIEIIPLVGPNSILLALIASGLNGQNFAFNGYLPVERDRREAHLKNLETRLLKTGQTQIFIETPYRNNHILDSILQVCNADTRICVASNIATPESYIKTQSVSRWRKTTLDLHKKPTVFLMGR